MQPHELKTFRHSLGYSVNEMAELCCVNERTVRRWEDGTRPIPGLMDLFARMLMIPAVRRRFLPLARDVNPGR